MCLYVRDRMRKPKANARGFCTAWKVVTEENESPFNKVVGYKTHEYKLGINVDRYFDENLAGTKSVETGFHLFLNVKDAKRCIKRLFNLTDDPKVYPKRHKIIQVFYKVRNH